jgi:general secretion pathway protein D
LVETVKLIKNLSHRAVFALLAMAIVSTIFVQSSAAATLELTSLHTSVSDDGSAVFRLTFNGPPPQSFIIRSQEKLVHVVLVSTSRGPSVPLRLTDIGTVASVEINTFAAVGLRVDLELKRPVKIRTQIEGNALLIHVPSVVGDEEAAFEQKVAERKAYITALPDSAIRTVYVPLNFAEVSEVAGLLVKGAVVINGDTFTAQSPFATQTTGSSSGSSSYSSSSAPTGAAPTYVGIPAAQILPKDSPQGIRFDDHVAVDRRLNAIILTGTKDEIDNYQRIISDIDVPTRSVVLETQIVELTQTAARSLGIDLSPNGNLATATYNSATRLPGAGSLQFRASLDAAQDNGQAKVLAQPRILALNGQPAAILSGEAVPIFNSLTVPSGGGTIIQQQVQYINVGVSLQILPRIADDGRVTVHIFSEVSTILGYVQSAPQIAVRQELTSAIVTDGDSLVIGGLLQQNDISNLRKIPGLGDIPLLGDLFKFGTSSHQDTNLYLVITPHVLSNRIVPPTVKPVTSH